MIYRALYVFIALLSMPATAQMLTIREARSLPERELARRVLGAAGSLYTEVERPGPDAGVVLPGGWRIGLSSLAFASRPRSSGFAGVCQAEVAFVDFRTVRRPSEGDPDPPARVSGLSTSQWYRIVDQAEPGRDTERASRQERRLERQCADAGPVFDTGPTRQGFFAGAAFGSSDLRPAHAAFAARALQQAIGLAERGAIRPTCTPNPGFSEAELCGDPAQRLAELSPAAVSGIELNRCSPAEQKVCVIVEFVMSDATPWSARVLTVRIRTDAIIVDPPPPQLAVQDVSLSGALWEV